MIEQNRTPERDEVLFAFHQTCHNPTAEQVNEWTRRYPQYADDIREHAAVRAQWASDSDKQDVQPNESLLARGRSQALNLLHNARQESAAAQNISEKTWPQAVSAAGFAACALHQYRSHGSGRTERRPHAIAVGPTLVGSPHRRARREHRLA
jgi:hypothetical protein